MNLRKLLPIASVAWKVTGADHDTVWNTDSARGARQLILRDMMTWLRKTIPRMPTRRSSFRVSQIQRPYQPLLQANATLGG
jgi:hypothetical protein